ncbi:MAG: zf-HC2 domain-containing protein [Deltaproteobacteria bacterium]
MKCHSVQQKLSAYQDRELKPQEQEEVSRHLIGCQSCREQYERLERFWQTLGGLEEVRPDLGFYPRLIRRVKEPHEQGLLPTLQHVFQLLHGPALASIILIIGLVAGIYLGSVMARSDLFPFQNNTLSDSQGSLFTSMKVFDPAPPGTFAEGYLRMVSYKENESR